MHAKSSGVVRNFSLQKELMDENSFKNTGLVQAKRDYLQKHVYIG